MIRTPDDHTAMALALAPVDQAFAGSEAKWGVGRLERLVSHATLTAYRRGWDRYRAALEANDHEAIAGDVGPKMIAALAYMDAEATRAGVQPISIG